MPIYSFRCIVCAKEFDAREGFDSCFVPCQDCGQPAKRAAFNKPNVIMAGASLPDRSDASSTQDELRKEMHKRGWDESRTVDYIRSHMEEDRTTGKKMFRPDPETVA